jgi:hypothetical protein
MLPAWIGISIQVIIPGEQSGHYGSSRQVSFYLLGLPLSNASFLPTIHLLFDIFTMMILTNEHTGTDLYGTRCDGSIPAAIAA